MVCLFVKYICLVTYPHVIQGNFQFASLYTYTKRGYQKYANLLGAYSSITLLAYTPEMNKEIAGLMVLMIYGNSEYVAHA